MVLHLFQQVQENSPHPSYGYKSQADSKFRPITLGRLRPHQPQCRKKVHFFLLHPLRFCPQAQWEMQHWFCFNSTSKRIPKKSLFLYMTHLEKLHNGCCNKATPKYCIQKKPHSICYLFLYMTNLENLHNGCCNNATPKHCIQKRPHCICY